MYSRYYDPATGRFVNADDVSNLGADGDLTGYNLYAYCGNNPAMRVDEDGEYWHIAIGAAIGAITNVSVTILSNLIAGENWSSGIGIAAIAGALSGALGATAVGAAAQFWGNAIISGTESFINQGIENGFGNVNYLDVLFSGVIGGFFARNSGVRKGDFNHFVTQEKKAIKRVSKALLKQGRDGAIKEAKAAAKYYVSQTWSLFYKETLSKKYILWNGIAKPLIANAVWHYGQNLV